MAIQGKITQKTENKSDPDEEISLETAAQLLGVTSSLMRRWCREGRFGRSIEIPGHSDMHIWVVTRGEIEDFKARRRPAGRPRKVS